MVDDTKPPPRGRAFPRDRMLKLAQDIGELSAVGSALWGDGVTQASADRGIVYFGVRFESGFDNYDELFRRAGFDRSEVVDFAGVHLDRQTCGTGKMRVDSNYALTPATTRGGSMTLMVRAYKGA